MNIKFVNVSKNNIEALRLLVRHCFPLTYTESLYTRICQYWSKYSRFALINGVIVGAIISRIDPVEELERHLKETEEKKESLIKGKQEKPKVVYSFKNDSLEFFAYYDDFGFRRFPKDGSRA